MTFFKESVQARTAGVEVYFPDAPPESPHASDDEFNGTSVGGQWTLWDQPTGLTTTVADGVLKITQASAAGASLAGYFQSVPSVSDYTFVAKVSGLAANANTTGVGIFLAEDLSSAPGTGNLVGVQFLWLSGTAQQIQVASFTQYNAFSANIVAPFNVEVTDLYIRYRVTSTTYSIDVSKNGIGWSTLVEGRTITTDLPGGAASMGVFVNNDGSGSDASAIFDFFRVKETSSFQDFIIGQNVQVGGKTTQLAGPTASYIGYSTASLGAMSSTTWADLIGGAQPVTTVTDQTSNRITRSNSDFTFVKGGTYQVDIRANQGSTPAQYVAIRLRGDINGTLAVGSTFLDASVTRHVKLSQQIEVSDGEVVALEYVVGTSAAGGWTTATLDSEALRGFSISIFSLSKTGDVSPRTGTAITSAYTAIVGERVLYDPSGGTFTITFPSSPLNGDRVSTKNVTADVTAVTLSGNGNTVEDPSSFALSASVSVAGNGLGLDYEFSSAQGGWLLV